MSLETIRRLVNNLNIGTSKEKLGDFLIALYDKIEGLSGNVFAGENASTEDDGLMSKEDKEKLDEIEEKANKYELPAATDDALGGVMMAAAVPDSSEAQSPTTAEFNGLLSSLRAAGILETPE